MLTKFRTARLNQSGLTIIEVLSALIILTLGVLGLAPLMTLSVRGSVRAENVTSVVAAAQQIIEQKIGAVGFPSIPYVQVDTFENSKYTVTTTIADNTVDNAIPEHVYRVKAVVTWVDDLGLTRTLNFTTYTTKN